MTKLGEVLNKLKGINEVSANKSLLLIVRSVKDRYKNSYRVDNLSGKTSLIADLTAGYNNSLPINVVTYNVKDIATVEKNLLMFDSKKAEFETGLMSNILDYAKKLGLKVEKTSVIFDEDSQEDLDKIKDLLEFSLQSISEFHLKNIIPKYKDILGALKKGLSSHSYNTDRIEVVNNTFSDGIYAMLTKDGQKYNIAVTFGDRDETIFEIHPTTSDSMFDKDDEIESIFNGKLPVDINDECVSIVFGGYKALISKMDIILSLLVDVK